MTKPTNVIDRADEADAVVVAPVTQDRDKAAAMLAPRIENWDSLPDATKAAIDPLVVQHDVFWSRGQIGFTEFPAGEREQYPPSPQRLVRTHSGSGRKTLYLSAHASHVEGWPVADGRRG